MKNKNQKYFLFLISLTIFGAAIFFLVQYFSQKHSPIPLEKTSQNISDVSIDTKSINLPTSKIFHSPLNRISERKTKKPFGIFIVPKNSPVQPERFSGYHTGVDFEIFPEEQNSDVVIRAICSGKIILKRYASGYGGVFAQSCEIGNRLIIVIYGHLDLDSISGQLGNEITSGEAIGILGEAYSPKTNGERKHLHLGIRKGSEMNILGYVQTKNELSDWIDPCLYICD